MTCNKFELSRFSKESSCKLNETFPRGDSYNVTTVNLKKSLPDPDSISTEPGATHSAGPKNMFSYYYFIFYDMYPLL